MGRKKIVAGNWKMNLDLTHATKLAYELVDKSAHNNVQKIIFPPFPFLQIASEITKNSEISTGAQNCSEHAKGAFTGEVSADMIKSCGADFCLIGHSERRQYFSETALQLAEKIKRSLENGLTPVFCIGEKLEERKTGNHFSVVENQLMEVLKSFSDDEVLKMIIAYEPVWAIGTGETATPLQAQEMHSYIRSVIKSLKGEKVAKEISILYGGSCNAQNAKELFACADVDGGLIGGASLKTEDFVAIMNSF